MDSMIATTIALVLCFMTALASAATSEQCAALKSLESSDQLVYRVGVHGFRGIDKTYAFFNDTFADYLTMTAGRSLNPSVRFEMVAVKIEDMFDLLKPPHVDFVFTHPGHFSCIDVEIGARSLVTLENQRPLNGGKVNLTQFGGVIFARADKEDIQTLQDLRGKRVGLADIAGLGAGPMQFRALRKAGLHHLQDPKQLIFTKNQQFVVDGVMEGKFDVGFVRTDQLERSIDVQTGSPLDMSNVKIIGTKSTPGFPFPVSTTLYPEWNVAAFYHVPTAVVEQVQSSLLQLSEHAAPAPSLQACHDACNELDIMASCQESCWKDLNASLLRRCDTTPPVAMAAARAATSGRYASWVPTLSYMELRSLQEEINVISSKDDGSGIQCLRSENLPDAVTCPPGTFKPTNAVIESSCEKAGLDCYGYQCICSPCIPVEETESMESYLLAMAVVIPVICVAAALVIYIDSKRRDADLMWAIKEEDLTIDEPPHVLGQGAFGKVILAEYNGTQVAVKYCTPGIPKPISKPEAAVARSMSDASERAEDELEAGLTKWAFRSNSPEALNQGGKCNASLSHRAFQLSGGSKEHPYQATMGRNQTNIQRDFVDEMRVLSKLRNPYVTTVMGGVLSKTFGPMVLVMEYMELGSLAKLIGDESIVFDECVSLSILRDVGKGMRFLHSAETLHCDIKSQNILIDSKFRAKIADFCRVGKKTRGTPFWMAPELINCETTNTKASDVYAFGILIFEVFSREQPYAGEDKKEVLKLVADDKIRKRPPVPESCSPEFGELMKACLRHDPSKRPSFEDIDVRLKMMETPKSELSLPGKASELKNIPERIAKLIREGKEVKPETHESATVMFLGISDYINLSLQLGSARFANLLKRLYAMLDSLCEAHHVCKVHTTGTQYKVCSNVAVPQCRHTIIMAEFAIACLDAANKIPIDSQEESLGNVQVQIGLHTGPVISHVFGTSPPRFSIIGETVTKASQLESSSQANRIQCSHACARELEGKRPDWSVTLRSDDPTGTSYWFSSTMTSQERQVLAWHKQYVRDTIRMARNGPIAKNCS